MTKNLFQRLNDQILSLLVKRLKNTTKITIKAKKELSEKFSNLTKDKWNSIRNETTKEITNWISTKSELN